MGKNSPQIVDEMARYEKCVNKMLALSKNEYPLNAFRIFNPQSMLGFLRKFPASAYCATVWKRRDHNFAQKCNFGRFGIDTKEWDKLLGIPVKYTFKRKLKTEEIDEISGKRFKELETDFTADDFA